MVHLLLHHAVFVHALARLVRLLLVVYRLLGKAGVLLVSGEVGSLVVKSQVLSVLVLAVLG